MQNARRDPDELLAQVQAREAAAKRGSLRIFFGYAAGVGKTYAMLEAAHLAKSKGRETVLGYVEPHSRPETQALVLGIESLPAKEIEYRGVRVREFDVDAALERHPDVLVVDELAHTNAIGSRHEKRWQDVDELLNAGINVWTTLNVQHIESLNDVIGQITGIAVRETIPDHIFDSANELELVDVTPAELLNRLHAGKVYLPEQAQQAIQSFFQKSNLTALRELSLRQAAQRIHTDVESQRRERSVVEPWATSDRLLVCVGPSPTTARVIRTAKRMAAALDAPWMAVSVDLTGAVSNSPAKDRIAEHFRLAERLGAETVTLAGQDVTATIIDFARSRNVTKILIGKTKQPRLRRFFFRSVVDELLERSTDVDIYVIHGEEEISVARSPRVSASNFDMLPYIKTAAVVALVGMIAYGLCRIHFSDAEANTVMLFLAAVAFTAYRYGRGPSIFASVLAVLVFDFFFIPPYFTLSIEDSEYAVTFTVMLMIGLIIGNLTARLRAQVEAIQRRERRTAALYELGKQLSSLYGKVFLVAAAGKRIREILGGDVTVYMAEPSGSPAVVFQQDSKIADHPMSLATAKWVIDNHQSAGVGTNTLPGAIALFLPVIGSQRTYGAIAIRVDDPKRLMEPDERRLLESCANQLAVALERDQLAIDASEARVRAETEQVRSSLLNGVSHDLKTPLAAIAGASSSLLESHSLDAKTQRQLLETVAEEANRLNRLLENILQMSKLDAGASGPNRQWHVLEEIVGSALHRTRHELNSHPVRVQLPSDLPLVSVDGLLIEQVFVNLFENAARYTPSGSHISVSADVDGASLRIALCDNGPGLPSGDEERIFDKFYRASPSADGGRGSGLGLAICRGIITAHGGSIVAGNRMGGGAEFVIRLPLAKDSPSIALE